jgi:CHRD domain
MNVLHMSYGRRLLGAAGVAIAAVGMSAFASAALADEISVTLSGGQETPPVSTMASGTGTITINPDMTVSGEVTTKGVAGVMAHIHEAPAGKAGPVIIPLEKSGNDAWIVPKGAKLTPAEYQAYKAGDLYVNVHSAAHMAGEIRGQLKPPGEAGTPGHSGRY